MEVKCPRCGTPTLYVPTNPWRPFCSERCQTIDLGAWADEQYRVPDRENDVESVNENTDDDSSTTEDPLPKHRLN